MPGITCYACGLTFATDRALDAHRAGYETLSVVDQLPFQTTQPVCLTEEQMRRSPDWIEWPETRWVRLPIIHRPW